jgi:hypothetical protein
MNYEDIYNSGRPRVREGHSSLNEQDRIVEKFKELVKTAEAKYWGWSEESYGDDPDEIVPKNYINSVLPKFVKAGFSEAYSFKALADAISSRYD